LVVNYFSLKVTREVPEQLIHRSLRLSCNSHKSVFSLRQSPRGKGRVLTQLLQLRSRAYAPGRTIDAISRRGSIARR